MYRICPIHTQKESYASGIAVIDTAMFQAAKLSKTYGTVAVVDSDGSIRGFGYQGKERWPLKCKPCQGTGKVGWEPCYVCCEKGVVPE